MSLERQSTTQVTIGILTYRRPENLRRLLDSIAAVEIPDGVALRTLVVDNDAEESARALVESRASSNDALRYTVEKRRGIATARNRVLDETARDADFIIFVDDDEFVEPGWLKAHVAVQRSGDYDAVFGPVFGRVPESAAGWLRSGKWYSKLGPQRDGDADWRFASTANVLIKTEALRRFDLAFNPDFNVSGSSDTDLFYRMCCKGGRLGWAAQAAVHEDVEPNRCSARWLIKRQYRCALMLPRILGQDRFTKIAAPTAYRAARGCLMVVFGALPGLLQRPTILVRGLMSIALAAGGFVGAMWPQAGRGFVEYGERPAVQ